MKKMKKMVTLLNKVFLLLAGRWYPSYMISLL